MAARGVKVRLITNGRDTALRGGPFLWAGYPTVMRLIAGGVEVSVWRANKDTVRLIESTGCSPELMPPIALHGKMLRIDDEERESPAVLGLPTGPAVLAVELAEAGDAEAWTQARLGAVVLRRR